MATGGKTLMEVEPISDEYFLFNVFENVGDNIHFKGFWDDKAQYVRKVDHFVATYLHYSENSSFPWVNFAVFDSDDVCVFGKPDPNWKRSVNEKVGADLRAYPAGYRRVGSSCTGGKYDVEDVSCTGKGFFLALVQTEDASCHANLQSSWKSSTYTDLLREKLAEKLTTLEDSHLFRRFLMVPKFPFVVRTSAAFDDPEEGLKMAAQLNGLVQEKDGVKVTFGYYLVETSYVK